jgi:hypothetical protein
MKKDIIQQMHDTVISGHLGNKKTKETLVQRYYWFEMKEDVRLYIMRCDICAADKQLQKPPKAAMGHIRSGAPWDT